MTSPIQQRNRVDSGRHLGTFFLWLGAVFIAGWIALALVDGFHVLTVIEVALGILFIVQGIGHRRRSAKALFALEAEHGIDAGKQERLSRPGSPPQR